MNILLLCEGNAETRDSWSGSSKSILEHLRKAGYTVSTENSELRGWNRWRTLAQVFHPRIPRWRCRFRLGGIAFEQRSEIARDHIAAHQESDIILQIGATFKPVGRGAIPYALYCDSNIRVAERLMTSGYTYASPLSQRERQAVATRESEVYHGAAVIFTISDKLRQSFIDDFQVPPERVHTVHAGPNFDVQSIPSPSASRTAIDPPTVLFVGKQFQRKGGDILLKAFRRVRESIPDAELTIVGPAHLTIDEPGIRCLGRLDKDTASGRQALIDAYTMADVFCLPTRFDSLGIVFLEAMYFGLPCIGSDHWAVPEMITDGETGYVVPVDEVDRLARRLQQLLGDRELARRMGQAARTRAAGYFTWAATVERMRKHINTVAAGHAANV